MQRILQSFWNPWNSRNRLSNCLWNRRPRLTRIRWVLLLRSLQKRILPSKPIQTRKQVRQLSPVSVSFTWTSSLTVCAVNSRWKQTLVSQWLHTVKPFVVLQSVKVNTSSSPVVVDSMVMYGSNSSLRKREKDLNLLMLLSEEAYLVNTSSLQKKV